MDEDIDDIETRYTVSKDKDARVGHKTEDSSFLGYKTHLAITEERIITAATITAGNVGDGPQLPKLVEKSKKNGINVETVIGDAAYGGDPNLKDAKNNNYEIIAKPNASLNGKRKDCDKFDYNKDADQFICPAGHMSTHSRIHQRKGKPENPRKSYFFDVKKCKICPLREGCYKEGSQNKAYSISVKTQEQIKQQEFVNTPHFKEKYRERYKIEAKNAELKNVHGYDRAISYGLVNMNLQGAMTIFAVNLKRILNLV
jgi:IS5 family transposase